MAKQLLGKEVTAAMNERLQARVAALKEKGVTPKLAIVRCGANPSDLSYEKGAESRATRLTEQALTQVLQEAEAVVEELGMELDFTSPGWMPEETLRALGLHLIPSCGACLSNMALAPDGSIIPCQSWLSSAPLGNMLTDDWASVWNSERCAAIRAESAKMDHICQLQGGNREEGARC